mgnify:CR=1 FL=1
MQQFDRLSVARQGQAEDNQPVALQDGRYVVECAVGHVVGKYRSNAAKRGGIGRPGMAEREA